MGQKDEEALRQAVYAVRDKYADLVAAFFGPGGRYKMTQLQLLVSEAGAASQIWHADNAARGITILVALDTVSLAAGPTELVAGSARFFDAHANLDWHKVAQALLGAAGLRPSEHEFTVRKAPLPMGSTLLFDSRTLHRGPKNHSQFSRPVFIMRFDPVDASPPGLGSLGTHGLKILGGLLERNLPWEASYEAESR